MLQIFKLKINNWKCPAKCNVLPIRTIWMKKPKCALSVNSQMKQLFAGNSLLLTDQHPTIPMWPPHYVIHTQLCERVLLSGVQRECLTQQKSNPFNRIDCRTEMRLGQFQVDHSAKSHEYRGSVLFWPLDQRTVKDGETFEEKVQFLNFKRSNQNWLRPKKHPGPANHKYSHVLINLRFLISEKNSGILRNPNCG